MNPSTAYDITRLVTRVLNVTPNGIDRIDFALARHFLGAPDAAGMMATGLGPRVLWARRRAPPSTRSAPIGARRRSPRTILAISASGRSYWGRRAAGRPRRAAHLARALRPRARGGACARRLRDGDRRVAAHRAGEGRSLRQCEPVPARCPPISAGSKTAPTSAPCSSSMTCCRSRCRNIFARRSTERFRKRLANLARFGTAALVTTNVVKEGLEAQLRALGRADFPICARADPGRADFREPAGARPGAAGCPVFRDLQHDRAAQEPPPAPAGLARAGAPRRPGGAEAGPVGGRGWKFEAVAALLDRSPALRGHVVEVSGLTTPSLKRLLDGARALLDALLRRGLWPARRRSADRRRAGHRLGHPGLPGDLRTRATLISPLDGERWLEAIRGLARAAPGAGTTGTSRPILERGKLISPGSMLS